MKKPADILIGGLFLCLLFTGNAIASPGEPFLTRNQSPFSLIFGLPHATAARLIEINEQRWITSINASNQIIAQRTDTARLFVDLETWQLELFYDYAFKDNWMFRIQLPLISHSGGILDNAIDKYHQLTGLPRDIRPQIAENQISIHYSENDVTLLNIDQRQKDLGDIAIQLAWQAQKNSQQAISHWMSIKLPTGEYEKLTGSGGTDIALWSSLDYHLYNDHWLYAQAGILYMSNNQVLDHIHNQWAVFANGGVKFQAWESLALKAQLDMHSALFDSEIKYLADVFQITFGGSYALNKKEKIDFAIAEDIDPGASPDVNFNISWWKSF